MVQYKSKSFIAGIMVAAALLVLATSAQAGYMTGYNEYKVIEADAGDTIKTYIISTPYLDCNEELNVTVSDNIQPYVTLESLRNNEKTELIIHSNKTVAENGTITVTHSCPTTGDVGVQGVDKIGLKINFTKPEQEQSQGNDNNKEDYSSGSGGGGLSGEYSTGSSTTNDSDNGEVITIPTRIVSTDSTDSDSNRVASPTPTTVNDTPVVHTTGCEDGTCNTPAGNIGWMIPAVAVVGGAIMLVAIARVRRRWKK